MDRQPRAAGLRERVSVGRALLAGLLALGSCAAPGGQPPEAPEVPWAVTPFPSLPAADEPAEVLDARVELGRLLFYDPILSADRQTACATCHSEIWGMGDGLPRSVGHGAGLLAGPGRRGGPLVRRNAPQLWNLAFRETLFWDGRVDSLEAQALKPLEAQDEMNLPPEQAVRQLQAVDAYRALFAAAFPDAPAISEEHLADALAAFQRRLVSSQSLYDGYLAGDTLALTERMQDGMWRFAAFGCPDCHRPPLFEREAFFDRELPPLEGVDDQGRFEVTGAEADRRAFRVPSLRNVAFSDPYFHDGSAATLEDAVRHELRLSGRPFEEEDVAAIERFLGGALSDERLEPHRPDRVPSGLEVPLDGTFVQRS